jgi:hypothetical protein
VTAATLRGIFLTSEQPEACARFYIDVAGLALEHVGTEGVYVYWKVDRLSPSIIRIIHIMENT